MEPQRGPLVASDFWIEGRGIRRIYVDQLFGQFSYELDQSAIVPPNHSSRLILLYGENGAGKTTVLRILFYALSSVDNAGHKSRLKRYRFRTFGVEFANGTLVEVKRQNYKEEGFEISITRNGIQLANARYFQTADEQLPNDDKAVVRLQLELYELEQTQEKNHKAVIQTLKTLDAGMLFVTDRRNTLTTISVLRQRNESAARRRKLNLEANQPEEASDFVTISLAAAVDQIGSWATRQAFSGSAQGEGDVNSVYTAIVQRLAHSSQAELGERDAEKLIAELLALEARSQEFARFGLTRRFVAEPLVQPLAAMDESAKRTALDVLIPYAESMKARFDALESVMVQLSQFSSVLRSFYRHKRVSLNVRQGLRIVANNEVLDPTMLSSGEGQLLYILASTLMAKEQASLFLIDEPEISLNVRWQRQLLKSLLDITKGTKIQFVMATHSIELLSRHSEFVVDLQTPEND